ncbi:hypothetical protein J2W48_003439 [Flavobacterium piscis]|uniref:Uncharacterized protein n=1 Tax=Flavobacterium piscis TaxID=1114874 RepID=A0ABU1YB70_9FLAO|nr:hypothetical protein [Flavobacterium piscis]
MLKKQQKMQVLTNDWMLPEKAQAFSGAVYKLF